MRTGPGRRVGCLQMTHSSNGMYVHACMKAIAASGVFLNLPPYHFWRQGLSLDLRLIDLARLAGQ